MALPELGINQNEEEQEVITVGKDGRIKISNPLIAPLVSNPEAVKSIRYTGKRPRKELLKKIGKTFTNCSWMYVSKSMWDIINKNHEIRDVLEKYRIKPLVFRNR